MYHNKMALKASKKEWIAIKVSQKLSKTCFISFKGYKIYNNKFCIKKLKALYYAGKIIKNFANFCGEFCICIDMSLEGRSIL